MAFSVSEFQAAGLPLGGARPSLFTVVVETPDAVPNVGARFSFTCKAASLPESKVSSIEMPYFGRKIPFAGSRTFSPWTVTVINDEDFQVRHAMELWSNLINTHEGNLRDVSMATPADYKTLATVTQYSKTGIPIRTYELVDVWPTDIAAITMDWNQPDTIEEFTVTLAYSFWRPVAPSTTGSFAV